MISFYQKNGFRFFFSNQENEAPAHVHVIGRGGQMIVWLEPISPALSHNLCESDQRAAVKIVKENHDHLMARWFDWYESFSRCA